VDPKGESLGMGQEGSNGDGRADEERAVTEFVDPWVAEAREKNLPEKFIERLAASDGVTEAEKARIVASVTTAGDLERKRKAAIEHGRRLGADEARSRNESRDWADSRIRRAMMYAAWEFDGKPAGRGAEYRKEFGIPEPAVSDPRVSLGSDFKAGRK
jgi:hypothetical protein